MYSTQAQHNRRLLSRDIVGEHSQSNHMQSAAAESHACYVASALSLTGGSGIASGIVRAALSVTLLLSASRGRRLSSRASLDLLGSSRSALPRWGAMSAVSGLKRPSCNRLSILLLNAHTDINITL